MIWVIGGLLFLLFGLYYIPIKESKFKFYDYVTPNWFHALVTIWALFVLFYIPSILNIFIDGLVNDGYVSLRENAAWIVSIGSIALIITIYKIYKAKLQSYEEKLNKENNLNV